MKARIYHNPRCSKSRATLRLLEERGVDVEVIEYLRKPLSRAELTRLVGKLGLDARDLVRSAEPEFGAAGISLDSPADELLDLLAAVPKLLQRPIVEVGERARIGRPPERVLELLA
jgi:arsenate reductase (glutaredoxin)